MLISANSFSGYALEGGKSVDQIAFKYNSRYPLQSCETGSRGWPNVDPDVNSCLKLIEKEIFKHPFKNI